MKIGFDAKRLYGNFTGLGNYSRTLVNNLAFHYPQHDYLLYTTQIKASPDTQYFLENSNYQTHLSKAIFKSYWRSFSILKQLKKDGVQLYHGLSHELPFGIHKTNIKSVVTIHDLIFKTHPDTYPFFDRLIYDWKFRYSCEHADKIIAISENTKKDIVHYYNINPDKIEVIYQACQPIYYTETDKLLQQKTQQKYKLPKQFLLYVGTIQERKNLKVLIRSYQHLSDEFKLPIVVVGNGGLYKKEVQELVQKMQLEELVIWLNNVDEVEELKALYELASILVYPSIYEGFGLPVAEALLCKTPVITSNVSSLPEAGGTDSFDIEPHDEKALALGIQKILSDNIFSTEMQEKGYVYAQEKFCPKTLSEQLLNCYKKTLSLL